MRGKKKILQAKQGILYEILIINCKINRVNQYEYIVRNNTNIMWSVFIISYKCIAKHTYDGVIHRLWERPLASRVSTPWFLSSPLSCLPPPPSAPLSRRNSRHDHLLPILTKQGILFRGPNLCSSLHFPILCLRSSLLLFVQFRVNFRSIFVLDVVQALSKIACNRLQKELVEWQVNPPAGFKHKVTDNLQRFLAGSCFSLVKCFSFMGYFILFYFMFWFAWLWVWNLCLESEDG